MARTVMQTYSVSFICHMHRFVHTMASFSHNFLLENEATSYDAVSWPTAEPESVHGYSAASRVLLVFSFCNHCQSITTRLITTS